MNVSKLASAVYNTVVAGQQGFEATINPSIEQLEDEVVETRLSILQKYAMANKLPLKDLYYSINCIPIDCDYLDKCCTEDWEDLGDKMAHFQIPQIVSFAGDDAIGWLGSTDKQIKFKVYTSPGFRFHKYKMRGKKKPFVYIDTTPNKNNLYDGYVFNAPMLETLSISAIFKDPRQLEAFQCCGDEIEKDNFSPLTTEIKDTLVKKYVTYYRQLQQPPVQNDQEPR